MLRWTLALFLLGIASSSYAKVDPEHCVYGKRGSHHVQEREYDKLLMALSQNTEENRKKSRKRTRSKGDR